MMYIPFITLSLAAAVSIVSGYAIDGDNVNCRSGPGTSYSVVKTYNKGHDVSITCQVPGTSINGDNLWDKTSDGCYVTDYYVQTGTSNYVTSKCGGGDGGSGSGGNLPGLDATKSSHARAIIAQAKKENLGHQGCLAAIATAITESNILIYANINVPASYNYPHDAVGSDHDSVGIFQQRAAYYPDLAADMDPAQSAEQFFAGMVTISGWQTMDVGQLCQAVQRSAYPDRYEHNVAAAEAICAADGV